MRKQELAALNAKELADKNAAEAARQEKIAIEKAAEALRQKQEALRQKQLVEYEVYLSQIGLAKGASIGTSSTTAANLTIAEGFARH